MRTTISAPPLTRASVLVFVILSLLVAGLRIYAASNDPDANIQQIFVPYLVLVPGISSPLPWLLFTTSWIEQHVVSFFITGVTLFFFCRYTERIWGSRQLGVFLLIQSAVPTVVTLVITLLVSKLFNRPEMLMQRINGGVALQMGFLVALKQLVPEHSIVLFSGALKIQFKYLVIPAVLLYTILGLIESFSTVILAWSGFFTAWIYLRFVKIVYVETLPTSLTEGSDQQKIRGDASDTFALAKFFYPAPISDAVASIANPVYDLLVKSKIIPPFAQSDIEASNIQASLRSDGLGNRQRQNQADSDRRRNLALKALEERMQT